VLGETKMKKTFTNLLLISSIFAFIPSCAVTDIENSTPQELDENSTLQELECLKYRVNVEYQEGTASLSLERNIDFNQYAIKNLQGETLSVSNIVGGDIVEVYTPKDNKENIDHIIVDEADFLVLSINHVIIPGSDGDVDLFVEGESHMEVDNSSVPYVISKNGSYETLDVWHSTHDGSKLYGTYREEEITMNTFNQIEMNYYHLIALYDYNPKAK